MKQIKEALERCTPRAGKPPSERFNIGYGEPIPIPLEFFVFLSSWVAVLGWGFNPSKQNYMGLWDPVIRILEFGMEDDYGSNQKPRMIHKCVAYRDKGVTLHNPSWAFEFSGKFTCHAYSLEPTVNELIDNIRVWVLVLTTWNLLSELRTTFTHGPNIVFSETFILYPKVGLAPKDCDSIEAIYNSLRVCVSMICSWLSHALIRQDPEGDAISEEDYLEERQAASNWD